jgi:hypothetical protein
MTLKNVLLQAPAKTREEKLKEQAEKMKVFAKQLQSMPEFAAVFKVGPSKFYI